MKELDLDKLGARHKELLAAIEELKPDLHAAMRAERAKLGPDGKHLHTQREIMERSGYKTIQQVRVHTGEANAQESLLANLELVEQMERTASDPNSRVRRGRPQRSAE